jgi:hypothetical protein
MTRSRSAVVAVAALVVSLAAFLTAPGAEAGSAPAEASRHARGGFAFDSARIPKICGQPPTRLVNGKHPDTRGDVEVFLRAKHNTRTKVGGRRFNVGVIGCAEFHPGPDTVVVWNRKGRILGEVRLGERLKSSYPHVRKLVPGDAGIEVQVRNVEQADDYPAPHIAAASLLLVRDGKSLVVGSTTVFTEAPAAAAFVNAIAARDAAAAAAFASADIVSEALQVTEGVDQVTFGGCIGPHATGWPSWYETSAGRMCWLITRTGEYESGFGLFMDNRTWNTYQVVDFAGLAG